VLGAFALGFVASRAFALFVQAVVPSTGQARLEYNLQISSRGPDLVVLLFAGGLLIPFVEELVFRGFGLTGYERRVRPIVAAIWTSVLFAAAHGVAAQALAVLPLGYVIARAVQFSGSFWTGVLVHATNNLLSLGLATLLLSNPAFAGMLESSGTQRISPVGGVVALAVTALSLWGATCGCVTGTSFSDRRPAPSGRGACSSSCCSSVRDLPGSDRTAGADGRGRLNRRGPRPGAGRPRAVLLLCFQAVPSAALSSSRRRRAASTPAVTLRPSAYCTARLAEASAPTPPGRNAPARSAALAP
jgi:hypothetical protein